MKRNRQFKIDHLLRAIRKKYVEPRVMFTLTEKIGSRILQHLKVITFLCYGRVSGLASRAKCSSDFFLLLLRYKREHGSAFVVKWLKANYVALQKYVGGDKLTSLRDLEPDLPLPRLINGCPSVIKTWDRHQIRSGNAAVIRYWSSLFSVYRVLKAPVKPKLHSITDPFSGDRLELGQLLSLVEKKGIYFNRLPDFSTWQATVRLGPQSFLRSSAASASNSVAWTGILSDSYTVVTGRLWGILQEYSRCIQSSGHIDNLKRLVLRAAELQDRAIKEGLKPRMKRSVVNPIAQLSPKEEAAGKLRIFAIVDVVTQSYLSPLHNALSDLLRKLPNDGTFDQEASVKRSVEKAREAGCAYSFDLSSATDRLPAVLSAYILECLLNIRGIGAAWLKIMVDREFYLSAKNADLYGISQGPYRYSVGQPMGALSSWNMLAITHHWIMQYASWRCGNVTTWETRYEILGDDLVIFSHDLAAEYLRICQLLGVEINLTKSISSKDRPVFEFAKRTYVDGKDCSPISVRQLIAGEYLGGRVANALTWLSKGMIGGLSLLATILSKGGHPSDRRMVHRIGMPLLSILGAYVHKGLLPLRWLVELLIDPRFEDEFDFAEARFNLPLQQALKVALVAGNTDAVLGRSQYATVEREAVSAMLQNELSKEEIRKEVFEDYEPEFANVVVNAAIAKAKAMELEYDSFISQAARHLLSDPSNQSKGKFPMIAVFVKESDGSVIHGKYFEYSTLRIPEGCRLSHFLYVTDKELRTLYKGVPILDTLYQSLSSEGLKSGPSRGLILAVEGFWEQDVVINWTDGADPAELVDDILSDKKVYYRHNLSLEHALTVADTVEKFQYRVKSEVKLDRASSINETAAIIQSLRKVAGKVKSRYWQQSRPSECD